MLPTVAQVACLRSEEQGKLFPWSKHIPTPHNESWASRHEAHGCARVGSWSEKTSEDGGNLSDDDAETQALGLEIPVEEVVGGRIRCEHTLHDRPPVLQKTIVVGMAGVEPMVEKPLPLARIGPEHPPIFEPRLVLIEQPSHRCIVGERGFQSKERQEALNEALRPGPGRVSEVAGFAAAELRGEEVGGRGHDQFQLPVPSRQRPLTPVGGEFIEH